ncbi:MAG: FxLYD domain-containing protein [Halorhabdus sp.]
MNISRRRYFALLGTAVSTVAVAGCSDADGTSERVDLLEHELVSTDDLTVTGRAKNVSGEALSYVEILVEWRADGALLDTDRSLFFDWPAGETRHFEISYNYADNGSLSGSPADMITGYTISVAVEP